MKKTHLAIGVLAAAVVVAWVAWVSSSGTFSPDASVAAPIKSASGGLSGVVLVTYAEDGFTPRVVKVVRGTSLRFFNASGRALRIAPLIDPAFSTTAYRGFEASQSVGRGESFEISLDVPGVWGYTNRNDTKQVGVVIVE